EKKPKPVAKIYSVPREGGRTSGDRSFFLYDKAEYVFGIDPIGKRSPKKLEIRFNLFKEKVESCLKKTGDEAVYSVFKFLEKVATGERALALPEDCASNDLFAFIYDPDIDRLVTDRFHVRSYWKNSREQKEDFQKSEIRCLVSGEQCMPGGLFPSIKRVPGGTTSGVALVSFNSKAFESYGWDGSSNASISRNAAETCSTALNRLLHPAYPDPHQPGQTLPRRNLRLSSDTAVLFWSADTAGEEFCSVFSGLLEGNPEQVKELYQSVWKGHSPDIEDPTAFYAVTISGSQGRAIVRDWLESTVAQTAENLAMHFDDLDIIRNTPKPKERDLPPQIPLPLLLESLSPRGDREQVPSPLIGSMIKAALHGSLYPLSVLARAVERTRAEIGRSDWADQNRRDARAALIKAVLNRRRRFYPETVKYMEVKRDMDPRNDSPGYSLGLLMAVLERLQQTAQGDLNATVVDRYFSSASATPKVAFVRLMKNARHHARKVKDDPDRRGMVYRIERMIDELAERFDPRTNGFPAHLDLDQQGLFVLGYHQMRKWLWMKKEERSEWEKGNPDAPRAFVWSKEQPADTNN
ncbi:MAG: type I-C CRISPR-associated protein Cas8c/Csd1, partial [Pseudomonadota bacterium]